MGDPPEILEINRRSRAKQQAILAAEREAELKAAIDAATADLRAENQRLRQFVTDSGTTCWPCEKCGHARTGKGCLWCERDDARLLARAFAYGHAHWSNGWLAICEKSHSCGDRYKCDIDRDGLPILTDDLREQLGKAVG